MADNYLMGHADPVVPSFEQDAHDLERSLAALRHTGDGRTPHACEVMLELGETHSRAGDAPRARQVFSQAVGLARELDDSPRLSRAAIGFGARFVQAPGAVDFPVIALLDEALQATEGEQTVERVRLLGQLCSALYYSDRRERLGELSREALAIAGALGDPAALAHACSARHRALWEPEHLEERLAAATDMVRLAERAGEPELVLQGRGWLLVDQLERGDIAAADSQQRAFSEEAEQLGQPLYLWHAAIFAGLRAIMRGDFEAGEQLTREAISTGQLGESAAATHYVATQLFAMRRDQGRLDELVGSVEQFVERFGTLPAWRCALTLVYQETGRDDDARRELHHLEAGGFDRIPRDANWLIGVVLLAEAASALRERDASEALYELLLPYRRSAIVVGLAAVCAGSASHVLGLLAAVLGRRAESRRHFEHALEMNAGLEAPTLLARTQAEYAWKLQEWGGNEDTARANELLAEARATAEQLGMRSLLGRLSEERSRGDGPASPQP